MHSRDFEIGSALRAIRETAAFKRASAKFECVIVAMVGYEREVPVFFGDNEGRLPVFFASTTVADLQDYLKRPDAEQPIHRLVVHGMVYVPTARHGERLKSYLYQALDGGEDDIRMRGKWRHCSAPEIAWPILMGEVSRMADAAGETFDVFDGDGREARVLRSMRRSR